tara:strand:- start:35195 stop:35635 length:441 start_codon:yes stop_codon:yes gene_type:complete
MKIRQALLTILFLGSITLASAQKEEQSIIKGNISIDKYHNSEELESMNKGKLLELYNIRIEIIIKILPNIAFATKPGVTMSTLGIPDTKDHRKALEENIEATATYFEDTIKFQKMILPYSDKSSLVAAILFYEETLKALHTYNEFN